MMMRSVASKELRWRASSPTHPKRARERGAEAIYPAQFTPRCSHSYSIEIPAGARILSLAGQAGIRPDGTLVEGFEAQHEEIWKNVLAILADANVGPENSVHLDVYSTDAVLPALWGRTRRSASPKGTCEPRHGLWSRRLPIPTGLLRCKRWQRKLISYEWLPRGTFVPPHCFLACDLTRARGDAVKA